MSNFKYILIYFIFINIISFMVFFVDKNKAKKDKWRIQEKTLHTLSFLGGSIGSIAAMKLFRHKTKKKGFIIITIIALLLNVFIYYKIGEYLIFLN